MKHISFALLFVSACSSAAPPQDPAPQPILFAMGDIETEADGRCFSVTRGPDTFETIIEQVEVIPATRSSDGSLINPAIFRNEARRVRIPSEVTQRFETVCPPTYTIAFVTSLQRALQARGVFTGAVNGFLDGPTSSAVQIFQERRGVNSPVLSIETARALGLVSIPTN